MLEIFFSVLLQFSLLADPSQDTAVQRQSAPSTFTGEQFSTMSSDTTSTGYGGGNSWDDND